MPSQRLFKENNNVHVVYVRSKPKLKVNLPRNTYHSLKRDVSDELTAGAESTRKYKYLLRKLHTVRSI